MGEDQYTSGNDFHSSDKYWIDHLDIPMGDLRDYIPRVEAGQDIMRPIAKLLAERDRITSKYREMMDTDLQAARSYHRIRHHHAVGHHVRGGGVVVAIG